MAPIVTLNDTFDHPLTTEEPILSTELKNEVAKLNRVDPVDKEIPPAIIIEQTDPNKLPEPSIDPPIIIIKGDNNNEEEWDEELETNTESNRYIPYDEVPIVVESQRSLRNLTFEERQEILVFKERQDTTTSNQRIQVSTVYGAGPGGVLEDGLKPTRRGRSYLVAFDFSESSQLALEWTMGTMMRDGDTLHVVTVVNREDNPDTVKKAGLSLSKELNRASDALVGETTRVLGQMLLYDIKLNTFSICGRVKDVLSSLIDELDLTMVVCGNKGRGRVKGILMGSISTYLVHKSSIPVTVIRPQKKKEKPQKKKPVYVAPLSHSVQTGKLAADELHLQAKQ